MESYGDTGILYSADYFSEATIARLLQPPGQTLLEASAAPAASAASPVPVPAPNVEDAVAAAWTEMQKDPSFVEAVTGRYSQEQGLTDLKQALATPITDDQVATAAQPLSVAYAVTSENGTYVHAIDGEPVAVIPQTVPSAMLMSGSLTVGIALAFVVIDAIAVIAAVAGAIVQYQKKPLASIMESDLGELLKEVKSPMAQEWQKLIKAGDKAEGISKLFKQINGASSIGACLKKFVANMSSWQIAIVSLQLLAAILLLIASGGTSLVERVVAVGAMTFILAADVTTLVAAIEGKPIAPKK